MAAKVHEDTPELSDGPDPLMERFPRPPPVELDVEAQRQFHRVGSRLFGDAPRPFMLGRWELGEAIGAGGMGVVYPSYDARLGRPVAIKVLQLEVGADIEAKRQRMLREARALAHVRHPNVIGIHDVEIADSQVFLVMELFPGRTLAEWLAAARRTWQQVVEVFVQAGEGLAALHRVGLVHRDFKPSNVLIDAEGQVRVIDLGLVCATSEEAAAEPARDDGLARGLTRDGALIGTLGYMSPEQLQGRTASPRSDQFSFCLALFEALFEARAFSGHSPQELLAEMASARLRFDPDPKRVPWRLRRLLRRGLRFEASGRFVDMPALLVALEAGSWRWRWWLAGGIAAALGASEALAEGEVSRCANADARVMEVWTGGLTKIDVAVASTRVPEIHERWGWLRGRLDAHARTWAQRAAASCAGREAAGEDISQWSCLEGHGIRIAGLSDALASYPDDLIGSGERLAVDLDERLANCGKSGGKYGVMVDPQRGRWLGGRLAKVWAAELVGHPGGVEAEAKRLLAEAEALGDPHFIAEAALQLGRVLGKQRRREAWPALVQARRQALRAGDLLLAADAAIFGQRFAADVLEDPVQARRTGELAEDLVLGSGDWPLRRADLDHSRGLASQAEGRFEAAEQSFAAAEASFSATLGANSLDAIKSRVGWLNARSEGEDTSAEEIVAGYEALIRRHVDAVGPLHPSTGDALYNGALAASEHGRGEEARAWAREAWQVARYHDSDSLEVHQRELAVAAVLLAADDHEAGRGWLTLALAGLRSRAIRDGTASADLHMAEHMLGNLEWLRGDFVAAATARERAAIAARSNPLVGIEPAREAVYFSAQALTAGGMLDEARERLEREIAEIPREALKSTRGGVLLRGQLGVVHRLAGRREVAAALLREAIGDGEAVGQMEPELEVFRAELALAMDL